MTPEMIQSWSIALIGGVLIGAAAVWLMAAQGRIMGVSGILAGLLPPKPAAGGDRGWRITFALGLIGWASDARMMRSQVLTIKEREYVIAAKATGATNIQIMVRHLLPNAIAPSIVLASLGVAGAILSESTLSFLGLGVEIPNASWGTMVDQGRNFFTNAWWYAIFPGATIMITVLGFNFVGDGLRDALDPRLLK